MFSFSDVVFFASGACDSIYICNVAGAEGKYAEGGIRCSAVGMVINLLFLCCALCCVWVVVYCP